MRATSFMLSLLTFLLCIFSYCVLRGIRDSWAPLKVGEPFLRDNHYYDTVIAISDDTDVLRDKVKNTMDVLSLYQNAFSIKAVVYTRSTAVSDYAIKRNLTVIRDYPVNRFGVPLYRSLMLKLKNLFQAKFYGYANGDILIDPSLFSHLPVFDQFHKRLDIPILFASRVYPAPIQKIALNVESVSSLNESLKSIPTRRVRIAGSADLFLYTNDFLFDTLPDAVIGRIAIDNIIVAHAKKEKAIVVDITDSGRHIHQGLDKNLDIDRSPEDKEYNMCYLNQYKRFKAVLNHADVMYNGTTNSFAFK